MKLAISAFLYQGEFVKNPNRLVGWTFTLKVLEIMITDFYLNNQFSNSLSLYLVLILGSPFQGVIVLIENSVPSQFSVF